MKKFEFKLEKLLSYKNQMLESELLNMGQLRKLLSEKEEELQALIQKKTDCKEEFEKRLLEKITPASYRLHLPYVQQLEEEITGKRMEISEVHLRIEEQMEVIKKIKLETKSLETLKNSRLEEYNKEDLKKAEHSIEEFVSNSKVMSTPQ